MELFRSRRRPNHTEIAYREAVAKLKYLLQESYGTKSQPSCYWTGKPSEASSQQQQQQQPEAALEYEELQLAEKGPQSARSLACNYKPAELSSLLSSQHEYIEQLEKESEYCRQELRGLIERVREVVAENEALQESNAGTKVFQHAGGPSIVLESRVSELEAQLTQARLELRQAQQQQQQLNSTVSFGDFGGELEAELARLRARDAEAQLRGRRLAELAQQAHAQAAQAELEAARLREQLDARQRELTAASQALAEERQRLEAEAQRRWREASEARLESERRGRQLQEQARELAEARAAADRLERTNASLQQQLETATAEGQATRERLNALEREARHEQNRLQAELESQRTRLERAESELLQARREVTALEREVNMNKVVEETRVGSLQASSAKTLPPDKANGDKDKELAALIYDLESKHTSATAAATAAAEGVTEQRSNEPNDKAAPLAASSSKKRRVKLDLKVKLLPKKTSAQSEAPSKAKSGQSSKQSRALVEVNSTVL